MSATWLRWLQKLAKETGSTLVMQETPPGRFSRADMHKYSRGEAIRILNRALEPKGFRIVDKNNFLIVLHLDDVRSQYRRPVVREADDAVKPTVDRIVDIRPNSGEATQTVQQTEVTDVTPRRETRRLASSAVEPADAPVEQSAKRRNSIRQVSHDAEKPTDSSDQKTSGRAVGPIVTPLID
jgi:hypothetical protein